MKDICIIVYKPVFTGRGMKKVKCLVKYYLEEEIADDFEREAKKLVNHYVDRDSFKMHVINEMLKGDLSEGVRTLVKLHKDILEDKAFFIKMFLETILES